MSDRFFLDTNIFVYSFEPPNNLKSTIARSLIEKALVDDAGVISFQVIHEFLSVSTRKFKVPLRHEDAKVYLQSVLQPLCDVYASIELYESALDVAQRWRYSFYDSLIIAAALQAKCTHLYSEDLQHGQKLQQLEIVNPFTDH